MVLGGVRERLSLPTVGFQPVFRPMSVTDGVGHASVVVERSFGRIAVYSDEVRTEVTDLCYLRN
jgi:hypothetical protein